MDQHHDADPATTRNGGQYAERPRAFGGVVPAACGAAAVAILWAMWSHGAASMARSADAGPPRTSALNAEKRVEREESNQVGSFDSGMQRERLINEVRALRTELSSLRALLRSGEVKAQVTSLPPSAGRIAQ